MAFAGRACRVGPALVKRREPHRRPLAAVALEAAVECVLEVATAVVKRVLRQVQGPCRTRPPQRLGEKDRIAQASREEGHAEGREEGRTETAIDTLHFLPGSLYAKYRDEIAACWREAEPPPEVMGRILKVQQAPDEWRRLLEVPEGSADP